MRMNVYFLLLFVFINFPAWAADKSEYPHWDYKVGFEERVRYEYKKDFDSNKSKKDNGSLFFTRERFSLEAALRDEYLKDRFIFFAEGIDAQTGGYRIKATANQTDDFDLHQAFIQLKDIKGSGFGVKVGRQELKYGKGRLIASSTWANRLRSFDAGVVRFERGGLYTDVLYAQDVKFDDNKFNQSRNEEFLSGIYGGYQANKIAPLFEAYFLSLVDIKGINDIHRHTVGGRMQIVLKPGLVADVEIPVQFGKTGTTSAGAKTIRAWAFHADLSQSFEEKTWKPKFSLEYDQASGDKDPNDGVNNTFVPLYQSTHDPYGIMDLVRWQNIRNPQFNVMLSPTEKFRFMPQLSLFWLDNKNDAWYSSSGSVTRTKTSGDRNTFLGEEASVRFYYDITKNIKFETGYAHFFSGGYLKDTGADDGMDWMYSQLNLKF